jgi:ATP-dependent RNA helicase DeaD
MQELFNTELTFADLGLREPVLRGVAAQGFRHPTRIQADLIPLALSGADVLGQSKTGTGKTAAFGLPMLSLIKSEQAIAGLILVPTRELAIQITAELQSLGRFTGLHVAAVYGGQSVRTQADRLKKRPQIIVGTPGRLMDMHDRGMLPYDHIRIAVLDEVDRMLDIGFRDDIRRILGAIKQPHQTIFVSATISEEIERLARKYMRDPRRLDLAAAKSLTVAQVEQHYFSVEAWDKKQLLLHLLTHEEPDLTLVFCRTKHTVDKLAQYLSDKGIDAHPMHGDMYQSQRNKVMSKLRTGELSVLIASDLASRGLDVEGITHVINYDLPEDPDLYVHRIGRTARAGRGGIAWSFVSPEQGELLTAIEKLTNVEIPRQVYDDFKPGPVPQDIQAERERSQQRAEAARPAQSRTPIAPPTATEAVDAAKFPGGIVPVALHSKRLGGRLRSRRR